jgi:hypothetical protein
MQSRFEGVVRAYFVACPCLTSHSDNQRRLPLQCEVSESVKASDTRSADDLMNFSTFVTAAGTSSSPKMREGLSPNRQRADNGSVRLWLVDGVEFGHFAKSDSCRLTLVLQ